MTQNTMPQTLIEAADVLDAAHDAYDSWLLLAESDDRHSRLCMVDTSGEPHDYDVVAHTRDAYESWLLLAESDELTRSRASDAPPSFQPVRFTDGPTCGLCGRAHASSGSVRLSCGHCFHEPCIVHTRACPTCGV